MAEGERRVSMRIRKVALAGVAVLLAGVALAVPSSASAALPSFTCGTQSSSGAAPTSTDARVGTHPEGQPAYDRFTLVFEGSQVPGWTAIPKSSSDFTLQPSGLPVHLAGTAGIRLDLKAPVPGYTGSKADFKTGFPQLAEVRLLQNFEGVVQWGLGLNHQSCKRIFTLSSPTRLVIDVPH
jgi:hypothetical protein